MSPSLNRSMVSSSDNDDDLSTTVSWTGETSTPYASSSSTEHADSSVTTFDVHPTASSSTTISSTKETPNTARWTRYLPEAYGIRKSVESSKYRWCARESALWGIATGSAMALHRIRMQSPISRIINVGFGTTFLVMGGSYYFCVKRRDYQEQMIELLMQLNTFEPVQNMPPERPIDHTHPFVVPVDTTDDDTDNEASTALQKSTEVVPTKQYVARLPERKEWQSPLPTQDASDIFQPYNNGENNSNNKKK